MSNPKDSLKRECLSLQQRGVPFKLVPSTGPTAPFPISLSVRVAAPDNCNMFDIYEIAIILIIASFDAFEATISVDAKANGIDKSLASAIQTTLNNAYKPSAPSSSWRLEALVNLIERDYRKLLMAVPGTLELYMGEDANGASMRRYAPAILPEVIDPSKAAEEEAEKQRQKEADEEAAREYWRLKKLEEEAAEIERKKKEAEQRRLEVEMDPGSFEKAKVLSKKEREELDAARDKQGKRQAKTGSNKKKFDPEAHAARKAARGE
ncbi:hypothetical protein HDU78_003590 [Chytriomyces hyalinus]|nr:hypothetical protein HDU78_003590 [Chytriomyces hyalinus]KAJ3262842.1 hypothetical protein HDU77_011703 [Chytriomyces hyalinus]